MSGEEQWHLRIDGQVFGPATRAQLEQFLRPPRLCKHMQVVCTIQPGEWHTIAPEETLEDVLRLVGIRTDETIEDAEASPAGDEEPTPSIWEIIAPWFKLSVKIIGGAGVLVALNVALLWILRDPHAREREILAKYETIWDELRIYQPGDVAEEDWRAFADNAVNEIEPITKGLAQSADRHQPIQQSLLYAGRDHLIPLLKSAEPPSATNPAVTIFERYLRNLNRQLFPERVPPETRARKRLP